MLEPKYLENLPTPLLKLFEEVEREILADMARRISKYDYWIPASDYQNRKLLDAGVLQEDILKYLAVATQKSEAELRKMMQAAGSLSLRTDEAVYTAAGLDVPSIKDSEPLKAILNAGYRATAQTMRNICRTTARTATKQFEDALDVAWLMVHSGAFDSNTAIRDAIHTLAQSGVQSIRYPSGRTDTLEVAVRRAVVTGVNQTSAKLQDELADELGSDLVEVSAHGGARPDHAVWQGKIFSRSGTHPKYPDFRKATGYGRVDGLAGVNCRHVFGPYFEGSPPVWTNQKLQALNAPNYTYNGRQLNEYEASQIQRRNERKIRQWKREEAALKAAGLDSSQATAKIKHWEDVQGDFLNQTDLARQYDREQIPVAKSQKSGIIRTKGSGAMSGGYNDKNDPNGEKRDAHAELYYAELRNSSREAFVDAVSKNSKTNRDIASKAYKHIFEDKHELDGEYKYFDPDYYMAESFRRLRTNDNVQDHDIVLLMHEALEYDIMKSHPEMTYEEAHALASQSYDYAGALNEWKRKDGE